MFSASLRASLNSIEYKYSKREPILYECQTSSARTKTNMVNDYRETDVKTIIMAKSQGASADASE